MNSSFRTGVIQVLPFGISALIFGMIFGYIGAEAGFSIFFISSMSYIIFAGSAQFITLLLLIENEPVRGIIIAAVLVNVRHLIYGAVLHSKIQWNGVKKLLLAYFLTDEVFLTTSLATKENPRLNLDWTLFGAGFTLWLIWNFATLAGFLVQMQIGSIISLPENFVIVASFLGFLVDHWRKYPAERWLIILLSLLSIPFGFLVSPTWVLVLIMVFGALSAGVREIRRH